MGSLKIQKKKQAWTRKLNKIPITTVVATTEDAPSSAVDAVTCTGDADTSSEDASSSTVVDTTTVDAISTEDVVSTTEDADTTTEDALESRSQDGQNLTSS